MLSFQNIEFLYGLAMLLPLAILLLYVLRWKRKTRQLLGEERLLNQLTEGFSPQKYLFKIVAMLIAIALLIVGAANLRKPIKEKSSTANGVDVMIALDVSKSMLAQDEKPTRLDKAKQFIYQLAEQLQNNRIGLVVFAGKAYMQMPLTSDVGAIKMFVSNANPNLIIWQGTVIADALTLCNNSLDTKEKKYKAAILITDGEDQDTKAVEVAKELSEKGVVVHTIGVGSVEGAPIMESGTTDYKRDGEGQTVISKLNIELLQQIATTTGGTYHYLDNTETISKELAETLGAMEKKAISNPGGYVNYDTYYFVFLVVALVLLLIDFFITENKKKHTKTIATLLLMPLIFCSAELKAQSNTTTIIKGNELYRKGDFKGAQSEYEKVLDKDNKNVTAAFNNANSLFKQQQYAEAAKKMEALANNSSDPLLQAKAWFNKGVAEIKQQQVEEAAASFKKSLLLNNEEATRENLQMALNELKKKQQNKQPDKNKPEPKNQPSKKQSEQQLDMLRNEEKRLQKEVQQKKFKPESGNEKDW